MSLKVLVASPEDTKLFVDLVSSCIYAKKSHPDLTIDLIIPSTSIPSWWSFKADWLKLHDSHETINNEYDLITQLHPSPNLATQLSKIKAQHRSGVVLNGSIVVNGRWAQTFLAQVGAKRFAPFSPHDLFNNILLGRTAPHISSNTSKSSEKWVVDIESFPHNFRSWAEELASQISFNHPSKTLIEVQFPVEPSKVSYYIGCNETIASWLAYHGVPVILLHENDFNLKNLLASENVWYQKLSSSLTAGQILSLTKPKANPVEGSIRYTNDHQGGLVQQFGKSAATNLDIIFDQLHYVILNYLNDLREIDLPIPVITPSCSLQLKGTKAVMSKMIHLNQFGMKFLQDFVVKVNNGIVSDKDIQEITDKIQEIDELTEKTLINYPELDVFRFSLNFAKCSAQGNNMVEVAKSLILTFHEFNQTLQIYSDLIDTIVKRHTALSNNAGT